MNDAGRLLPIPKGDYNSGTTYDMLDVVYYLGKSYIAKKTTTGAAPADSPDDWQLLAAGSDATDIEVTDTSGLVGLVGGKTPLQTFLDEVADRVATKLVTNSALTTTLANYLTKSMLTDDTGANSADKVPNSVLTHGMNTSIQANTKAIADLKTLLEHPDTVDKGGYIGRRIEGGGTIFFDYVIGFNGDISVVPITANLHSYHVDLATGMVVCDDPDDSQKKPRFYVVSDYDIGDYKHGTCLMWSKGTTGQLYTSIGTKTGFGEGYNNTQLGIAAAKTDGILEWNTDAYNSFWHYVWKGDWQARSPKWFVPSKDELNVLLNMQWHVKSKRMSYDGKVQLKQLPINFHSYYWSSSESTATVAHNATFCDGDMSTSIKYNAGGYHVRLVRTF